MSSRNAAFQQWQALLTNRAKRQRAGEFLVQGVRPVTLAVEHGWTVRTLLRPPGEVSRWARDLLAAVDAEQVEVAPELLAELADKDSAELVAVVALPPDRLDRIPLDLVVVFDRPATPGNIGTLVRSADAFGASGLVVTGHAADPYDPRAVRASTGSLFALPVVRVPSHREVLDWAAGAQVVGTDEDGTVDVAEHDLTGPTLLLVGNETAGLSAAWRDAAGTTVRIPISGAASSLNAAAAGTVVLYEAARQRRAAGPRTARP
ncbi:MAG: 23S rRNA (uridine(2479)-2'-O)-methyltransferase [uncultured Corynebacteriales bacterium]|uniref:23S rRNA (Uridine(2479)-2'-O)-methyltransferase n=1 Tax=uncultured Mycobacteriales bacterium TaxID=581187 RepID=A0A6J4JSJ4_9ACTN|nr:MAG: 23S rRNA (uridine(2479)-2'-O)-methyltransferase [uncultured Corynebacteriales bacterium]